MCLKRKFWILINLCNIDEIYLNVLRLLIYLNDDLLQLKPYLQNISYNNGKKLIGGFFTHFLDIFFLAGF